MTFSFPSFGKLTVLSLLRDLTNNCSNEDVSETMYRETLKTKDLTTKTKLSLEQVANKVNRISDAFLAVLEQQQYKDEHLQNIITSHVSKVPPALEAGLEMIGRLQCQWSSLRC